MGLVWDIILIPIVWIAVAIVAIPTNIAIGGLFAAFLRTQPMSTEPDIDVRTRKFAIANHRFRIANRWFLFSAIIAVWCTLVLGGSLITSLSYGFAGAAGSVWLPTMFRSAKTQREVFQFSKSFPL